MATELTPMMRQYREMKAQVPTDALLMFRLGDFYEMFFEDAKAGAGILGLTLTQRNGVPMCGVPYHAAQSYMAKLLAAGRRVAICDQMEAPRPGQVVRREVTQVLTPGTVIEPEGLDASRPNYLAAWCWLGGAEKGAEERVGLAFLDTTTGDFRATELGGREEALAELGKMAPSEVVVPDEGVETKDFPRAVISAYDAWTFGYDAAFFTLRDHFKTQSLDGFGCEGVPAAVGAAGALLHYVGTALRRPLVHVRGLHVYHPGSRMRLDEATRHTLELVEPARRGGLHAHTLLGVLDRTCTAMGARLLRDWILQPLREMEPIVARQLALVRLTDDMFPLAEIRERLGAIRDIERLVGRLSQGGGGGRELLALRESLEQVEPLRGLLGDSLPKLLAEIQASLKNEPALVELIGRAIHPECPLNLRDGGVIADGFDETLDGLRKAMHEGKQWVAELQLREQERTGIKSLKVRFNSVFGYYIEVTKSNLASVPSDYHRKQTTAGGERFITPELKEMEARIVGAEDRARALEQELFAKVREQVLQFSASLQRTARHLANLDALAGLAEVARRNGYVRPEVVEPPCLAIRDGRHPVLEQAQLDERFVPNDTVLDGRSARLMILTGPNMAGKSTYLRQVALLALMAHMGSFVPAASARIGIMDRIFTRVGASDDLSRGQSTFMVEMNETANILHHATERSLVVLDEIGRGTSTFDGLSIAWSVAEHLHDQVRALTLFATHYHETTVLSQKLSAAVLMNVAVREWNEQVIFLRKIVKGSADRSYGIQVARLAGLPTSVLDRARILLNSLETGALAQSLQETSGHEFRMKRQAKGKKKKRGKRPIKNMPQMDLFLDQAPAMSEGTGDSRE
jgi:DNA mismatch repair protein MutS